MEIRQGISVCPGYGIGPALVLERDEYRIRRQFVSPSDVPQEVQRLHIARERAIQLLKDRQQTLARRVGESAARIIGGHVGLLSDDVFRDEIIALIQKNNYSSEYAVSRAVKTKLKALEESGGDFFAQRLRQDFAEIERALIQELSGNSDAGFGHLDHPVILVTHSLSPAQIATLEKGKILGLLLDVGGRSSHAAIVAASLGLPTVVGLETMTHDVATGDTVVVDGGTGRVIVSPDEGTLKRYRAMERNFVFAGRKLASELRDVPAVTQDGQHIEILANIEFPEEIEAALRYGANGVGLYRTEFIYLRKGLAPTEADHLEEYRRAISLLGPRPLVIRTLDLGADKVPVDGAAGEENPYLGTRAIRLCFQRPDLFRAQLRAILRASPFGDVRIMFPLVTSVSEIIQARDILSEVKEELSKEGQSFRPSFPLGVMIETPSAALTIDILAEYVDFFSVGTNDLIAYSTAVDRSNERVAKLYQPAHPAILRILRSIIETAHQVGRPVSVCGEMASDITFSLLLIGLGLRSLSVVPPAIPEIKKVIRSVTLERARAVAQEALSYKDARQTLSFLREETGKLVVDYV